MKTRLITFQPNNVLRMLESGNDYIPVQTSDEHCELIGFTPVFCNKLESTRQFMEEYIITSKSYPQSLIVFETDDFMTISRLGWTKYYATGNPLEVMNQHGYRDYLVRGIKASQLIGGFSISEEQELSAIQNDLIKFMESRPYEVINKFIPKNRQEKIKMGLTKLTAKDKQDYVYLISKLHIGVENTTDKEIAEILRKLAPKLLTKIGK